LNFGDWIKNFTALEYQFKSWKLYHYKEVKRTHYFLHTKAKEMKFKNLITAVTITDPEKINKLK